jgi:hypothetical protein
MCVIKHEIFRVVSNFVSIYFIYVFLQVVASHGRVCLIKSEDATLS